MKKDITIYPHLFISYLLKNFPNPHEHTYVNKFFKDYKIADTPYVEAIKVKDLLNVFEKNGYLKWHVYKQISKDITDYESKEGFKILFASSDTETLSNNLIWAKLTADGIDYAINTTMRSEEHESILKTNFLIPVLTGALVIVSAAGLVREILKDTHTDLSVQQLQKQMKSTDSLLQIHTLKDSLFEKRVEDSLRISP